MSGIKPSRRWQPAFYPFKKERRGKRILAKIELAFKGPVFGCRMCGNCLLQETAFICPMECPKGLRNGPCGGVTPEGKCYIEESRKCIWNAIYMRAFRTGREKTLLEILPPLDWNKAGTETWGEVIREIRNTGTGRFVGSFFIKDRVKKDEIWDSVFKKIRQPQWWSGDDVYHSPAYGEPASKLESELRKGSFVIATEVMPPLSSSPGRLKKGIELVMPFVSAINFTDSSSATPKMSSLACSIVAAGMQAEPVFQIAARDVTRTSLQSTVLGAGQFGIKNILCITGDSAKVGPSPSANLNLLDIDSVQMLWILRKMRDEGIYLDGRKIKYPPEYFLGASSSPFAMKPEMQALRDHKKVNAGAQFLQTNIIFEPARLDPWLEELDKRNIIDKVYILIGIAPLKSYKVARYLHDKVPGVFLPGSVLKRMEKAGDGESEEGIKIVLEAIEGLKGKKGVNGIHIMTLGWEEAVERIVKHSGLYTELAK